MWQQVHLSQQTHPRDTLECCCDMKQASNKQQTHPGIHYRVLLGYKTSKQQTADPPLGYTIECCWDIKQASNKQQIHPWDTLECCWNKTSKQQTADPPLEYTRVLLGYKTSKQQTADPPLGYTRVLLEQNKQATNSRSTPGIH